MMLTLEELNPKPGTKVKWEGMTYTVRAAPNPNNTNTIWADSNSNHGWISHRAYIEPVDKGFKGVCANNVYVGPTEDNKVWVSFEGFYDSDDIYAAIKVLNEIADELEK